jgi:hypothetical protein
MGVSTNGEIFYGVVFEEDYEFPWDKEHDGDIDAWWLYGVHGFKHSFELYDAMGNCLNGREPSSEESGRYFDESRAFVEAHPLPVELVNYCSGDYPMYALAVPGTVITARRGYPAEFDPATLTVKMEQVDALREFCADHEIEFPKEPAWLLTSCWD